MPWTRDEMAARAARELKDDYAVRRTRAAADSGIGS